jgi:uncharacterized membrane protein
MYRSVLAVIALIALECAAHFALPAAAGGSDRLLVMLLPVAGAVSHAAIYLFLLVLFGRTLLPGRVPLITRLAHRAHGALAPGMDLYTRRVTVAWCLFFAGQLTVAGTLFMLAPLETWSLFVNVLNLPLLAAMFAGEHVYRITAHPEFPRASLSMVIGSFFKEGTATRGAAPR